MPTSNLSDQPAAKTKPIPGDNPGIFDLEDRARIEQVWAERAVQMAKVITQEDNQGKQVTVVLMRLGRELLGIEVQYVIDIRPREGITCVPRVPGWVVGVTNLRGNILSVIDLRKYLDLPADANNTEEKNPGLLLVVRTQMSEKPAHNDLMYIIFLVDDVRSVETLLVQEIATDRQQINGLRPEYILAIAERKISPGAAESIDGQQYVVILNGKAVLADPRLIIHEEIG